MKRLGILSLAALGLQSFSLPGVSIATAAVDGEWTNGKGGNWTTPGNWKDSQLADGPGATATFGQTRIASDRGVITVGDRTVGHIVFDNDKQWIRSTVSGNYFAGPPTTAATFLKPR
ncbi:MAG: hypothetical protein LBK99_27590 [Opitutaceae bacterium]|jgi:hypothetical protein|nr:hypothetical protein [Opitutaceae bacterium]